MLDGGAPGAAGPFHAVVPPRGPSLAIGIENALLAVVTLSMVLLPIAELVLRAVWHVGIEGVANIVLHLALAAGMLGAAIAARERSLLSLALVEHFDGPARRAAAWFGSAVGAAVAALFAFACLEFVLLEREVGAVLVYGVPQWIAELPLPVGFALIAWRLVRNAAPGLVGRSAVLAVAACLTATVRTPLVEADALVAPALVVIGAATVCGMPIFAALGGLGLVLLMADGSPAAAVAVNHYSLVTNPTLPAIPLFTLAGYLLAESRAPKRLLAVFDALFGRVRGGAAIVTVLACTFFTCFTGASGVAILTLGGLVMPLLLNAGVPARGALGLVTAAGLPGVLLMPALPLLLYAIVGGVGIHDMFLGGVLPALIALVVLAGWGMRLQPRRSAPSNTGERPGLRQAVSAARWELSLPLVPVLALATSLATPVEAAGFTAAWALFVVTVAHRDLSVTRDLPRVIAQCGVVTGGILLVLGVALSLTNYLVDAELPVRIVDWVTRHVADRWVFLLALNAVLLLAGCVMDIFTAIVVLVPLVAPLGAAYGIHPVHLGIVFLANLEIGYLTPPVGMNLFFAASRFGRPLTEVVGAVLPMFLLLGAALLVVTYVPWFSTALLR